MHSVSTIVSVKVSSFLDRRLKRNASLILILASSRDLSWCIGEIRSRIIVSISGCITISWWKISKASGSKGTPRCKHNVSILWKDFSGPAAWTSVCTDRKCTVKQRKFGHALPMVENKMYVTFSRRSVCKLPPVFWMSVEMRGSNTNVRDSTGHILIFNLCKFFTWWKTFKCSASVEFWRKIPTLVTFANVDKSSDALGMCSTQLLISSRPVISNPSRWSGGVKKPRWRSCRATGMTFWW